MHSAARRGWYVELMWQTTYWGDVWARYIPNKEPYRIRDHVLDKTIDKLK